MLKCSSVPTFRLLRNFAMWRSSQAWCFCLCWCALYVVLPRPAVRLPDLLAISPLRLSKAILIPDHLSLTLDIVWCLKPISACVFGGTKEASYASL